MKYPVRHPDPVVYQLFICSVFSVEKEILQAKLCSKNNFIHITSTVLHFWSQENYNPQISTVIQTLVSITVQGRGVAQLELGLFDWNF